ncbi:hypothetical protein [Pseudonocardia alaniniphila]|uniref:Uncharacterized protein n=1 Tax=Pseudonocardia alaniniphila TaxID=75291 RepID=A0ABS9TRS8_9PSEU|nr:hypothetical protein [Pseudonocardia alaniniphila]MCH6171118.1 hypothetical protein [Pseudonocardia alaniniphila]
MTAQRRRQKRPRGSIEELPSGSLRVSVYTGIDAVTKRRHYLSGLRRRPWMIRGGSLEVPPAAGRGTRVSCS